MVPKRRSKKPRYYSNPVGSGGNSAVSGHHISVSARIPRGVRLSQVVNLLPYDSTRFPNLALEKVRAYYEAKGKTVISSFRHAFSTETWVSVILERNREAVANLYGEAKNIRIGGSGWDLDNKLPSRIERLRPKLNFGFATRGCIRNCGFCVVPRKEGKIQPEADIYDMWDRKSDSITLLDNNILAHPEHFELICSQLIKEKLKVDINQGLDIRLVTDRSAYLISRLRFPRFARFALDDPALIPVVRKKLRLLRKYRKGNRYLFLVLTRFNTTFDEDLERLNFLRSEGVQAFVMRYDRSKDDKLANKLANWANGMASFRRYTFEEYVKQNDRANVYSKDSPIVLLRQQLAEKRKEGK